MNIDSTPKPLEPKPWENGGSWQAATSWDGVSDLGVSDLGVSGLGVSGLGTTGDEESWWKEGLDKACLSFQADLSCLVDGELDGSAASRAIAHLEDCRTCSEFFEDARLQLKLHLDMADPERLMERYAELTGKALSDEVEALELVHRLSSIFYQIGKAYVLSAIDTSFRTRVFEPAVKVATTRTRGRGFIDGVVASGRGRAGGVDWAGARHMLNGQLSQIEGALEKGSRLLKEAIQIEPGHEEARLYLAFVDVHEGRRLRAFQEFQDIFDSAVCEHNRGHAAVQLSKLYASESEWRKAIVYLRWLTLSGLADADERFFFVRFNLGTYYANLGDQQRSLRSFRELLDRSPHRVGDVAGFFERSPRLQAIIQSGPGFAEALMNLCPELFRTGSAESAHDDGAEPHGERGQDAPGELLQ